MYQSVGDFGERLIDLNYCLKCRLDGYLKDSRNLKRVDDPQRRVRLLHQGKVDVVSFLSKLPNTLHDPASLIVDVPVFSVILTACKYSTLVAPFANGLLFFVCLV